MKMKQNKILHNDFFDEFNLDSVDFRRFLFHFYKQVNPTKIRYIEDILEKYANEEHLLIIELASKYDHIDINRYLSEASNYNPNSLDSGCFSSLETDERKTSPEKISEISNNIAENVIEKLTRTLDDIVLESSGFFVKNSLSPNSNLLTSSPKPLLKKKFASPLSPPTRSSSPLHVISTRTSPSRLHSSCPVELLDSPTSAPLPPPPRHSQLDINPNNALRNKELDRNISPRISPGRSTSRSSYSPAASTPNKTNLHHTTISNNSPILLPPPAKRNRLLSQPASSPSRINTGTIKLLQKELRLAQQQVRHHQKQQQESIQILQTCHACSSPLEIKRIIRDYLLQHGAVL